MSQITPFVKRMRTQGGTLYTFSSAVEDIGININERNNEVRMSHFALLDLPEITANEPNDSLSTSILRNKFNPYAIPGALKNFAASDSIKDGRVVIAESFQNYALNLETNLLASSSYNPALLHSVTERVFWKWLKETGAIRWKRDESANNWSNQGYFKEEIDTDSSTSYNSVVKYIGEITAGAIRTDTYGTYNETYVVIPTSHGQTKVWFKQKYDDNYQPSMSIGRGGTNIYGKENYTKPHPDGLSFLADYDVIDSSVSGSSINYTTMETSLGSYTPGFWYNLQGKSFSNSNWYVTDASNLVNDTSTLNYDIKYSDGSDEIEFRRSNVDALNVVFDLDTLRTLEGDSTLTYDKMAIELAEDDSFEFNAILLYYKVWDPTKNKNLATNLLGILFLDAASGSSNGFPNMNITIPTSTKLQSTASGFGSAYSFRVNIKSDNMMDDTHATIYDQSTSAQLTVENWGMVFDKLEKSLSILNEHTGTVNYITNQYLNISNNQSQQANTIADLQYQVNDIAVDITGTRNSLAMFADGDDPLVDSSIYMRYGNVGILTNNPKYPLHVDGNVKTKDIYLENAIRDTSGNILLGYGSPLQIGSSTNYRNVTVYTGRNTPLMTFDASNNISVDSSLYVAGKTKLIGNTTITGDTSIIGTTYLGITNVSGTTTITGNLNVTGTIVGDVSSGSSVTSLSTVQDVSVTGVPDGSALVYNSDGYWTYGSISAGVGGGISWSGSTANGVATYGSSSTVVAESNLTFNGSVLGITGDITFNDGGIRTIKIDSNAGAGDDLVIEAGLASSGQGGDLRLGAGNGPRPGSVTLGTAAENTFIDSDGSIIIGSQANTITGTVVWDTVKKLLSVDGSIAATNEITAYASDERLKINITPISNPLEKIEQIGGYTYNWKDNVAEVGFVPNNSFEVGVIAQEIGKLFPDAIAAAPFDIDPYTGKSKSGEDYITVKHHKIIPLLIEAVKELSHQVKDLKKEIEELKK